MMKAHIKQHRLFAVFVPAFVFACTAVGGYSFARSQSFDAIFNSFSSTILAGCALVLLTVLFALVIARAFSSIEGAPKAAHAPASLTEALRKHFLLYFAILIIAWLPVLIIHAPGTLAYDTLVQMMVGESLTEYYSAHNPPFDTWIFGLFWALGDFFGDRAWGVAAHSIFQAPLTAAAVAGAFCWLRLTNMPSAVRVLCMAIACALPWFPLAAETMSKDSLFSFFYLAWSVLFLETIRTRGAFLRKTPVLVLFFFATLFVALSKKRGFMSSSLPPCSLCSFYARKAYALSLPPWLLPWYTSSRSKRCFLHGQASFPAMRGKCTRSSYSRPPVALSSIRAMQHQKKTRRSVLFLGTIGRPPCRKRTTRPSPIL